MATEGDQAAGAEARPVGEVPLEEVKNERDSEIWVGQAVNPDPPIKTVFGLTFITLAALFAMLRALPVRIRLTILNTITRVPIPRMRRGKCFIGPIELDEIERNKDGSIDFAADSETMDAWDSDALSTLQEAKGRGARIVIQEKGYFLIFYQVQSLDNRHSIVVSSSAAYSYKRTVEALEEPLYRFIQDKLVLVGDGTVYAKSVTALLRSYRNMDTKNWDAAKKTSVTRLILDRLQELDADEYLALIAKTALDVPNLPVTAATFLTYINPVQLEGLSARREAQYAQKLTQRGVISWLEIRGFFVPVVSTYAKTYTTEKGVSFKVKTLGELNPQTDHVLVSKQVCGQAGISGLFRNVNRQFVVSAIANPPTIKKRKQASRASKRRRQIPAAHITHTIPAELLQSYAASFSKELKSRQDKEDGDKAKKRSKYNFGG